ncbi:hypothetical protein DH2020_001141 [Rehmannia glutinosa]|uniref:WRC domain-containing protein n=1 Tax=Rehmannia glutinosa TaxID=99300 RepID=A0ABR0XYH3_REHGL
MRIRKHAKISPLLYAASSLKPGTVLQTHVCQLNQSPWDVMKFSPPSTPPPPPPPSQANGDGVSGGNGSLGNHVSVVERELNRWRQWEYSDDTAAEKAEEPPPPLPPPPPPPPAPAEKNEKKKLCCKTDGKSWQCQREASKGNSLCDHHLSLVKSYNNSSHHASKKSEKLPVEARRRTTRPKKAPTTSSSSNPHEFYYYSGFGPRWGKKRGENKNNASSMPNNHDHEDEIEPHTKFGFGDLDEDSDSTEYEEDDEDDDEEMRDNGKKRVRKPIKARSLKSLM